MSGPSGYDPGWNDPPKLSFDPLGGASKPKNRLNKRVPFNGVPSATPPAPPPAGLPPSVLSGPPPALPTNEARPVDAAPPNEDRLERTLEAFGESIGDGAGLADVEKRLGVMRTMWQDGKLNDDVKTKTFQLATALKSDPDAADLIHKSLMVDHTGQVSPWMVGVKRLILHCQAKRELLNIDKEESAGEGDH